jgi:hypothetical protein
MNLDVVESIDGVPIRLTDERWEHICEHPNMSGYYESILDTIQYPEFVLRGHRGAKTAIQNVGRRKWLHVNYRELSKREGFIISAFIDDDYDENLIIWRRD